MERRYDQKVIDRIAKNYERAGAIQRVDEEHYREFIELEDDDLEFIIKVIIVRRREEINTNIASGKWTKEKDYATPHCQDHFQVKLR